MTPWSYLVCNPYPYSFDLANLAHKKWDEIISDSLENNSYKQQYLKDLQFIRPSKEIPNYINQLLQNNLLDIDDSDLRHITIFSQVNND